MTRSLRVPLRVDQGHADGGLGFVPAERDPA